MIKKPKSIPVVLKKRVNKTWGGSSLPFLLQVMLTEKIKQVDNKKKLEYSINYEL